MLNALLIDDEPNNLESLEYMLHHDCEGIRVAGKVQCPAEARHWLATNSADVIFLDISMPGENGFEFLESLPERNCSIIFITAYNEYALQAIKASALDYLVKPVAIAELQQAVEKAKGISQSTGDREQNRLLIKNLLQSVNRGAFPRKIALPQLGGTSFIAVDDMISLQADSNYTIIHLKDLQKLVISRTLKDFEELLDGDQFVRIHKSYIVNLHYLKEYSTTDGGIVKMTDGNRWSVSRRQLDLFLEKMKGASLMFPKGQ